MSIVGIEYEILEPPASKRPYLGAVPSCEKAGCWSRYP